MKVRPDRHLPVSISEHLVELCGRVMRKVGAKQSEYDILELFKVDRVCEIFELVGFKEASVDLD